MKEDGNEKEKEEEQDGVVNENEIVLSSPVVGDDEEEEKTVIIKTYGSKKTIAEDEINDVEDENKDNTEGIHILEFSPYALMFCYLVDKTDENEEEEENIVQEKVKRNRTGNSLFRMQLEEEARKLSKSKVRICKHFNI